MQAIDRTFMHVISIHKHVTHTDESCHDKPAKDPGTERPINRGTSHLKRYITDREAFKCIANGKESAL